MPNIIKTPNSTKHHTRKRVLIVMGILLLIACAVGAYFYWNYTQQNNNQQGGDALRKLDNASLAGEINKLVEAEKYDEAQALIKYQDEADLDPSKIILQARILSEQNNHEGALKVLRDAAAKNDENAYYYVGHEARTLALMGNKQAAIEKYNTAIDMAAKTEVKQDDEEVALQKSSRVADYEFEIRRLEDQQ